MKKTYIIPTIKRIVMLEERTIVCASGVTGDGIGYGGVDKDGSMDPSAKYDDISFNENILSDGEE